MSTTRNANNPQISERNRILDAVAPAELSRILPLFEPIALKLKEQHFFQGERIKYCLFPLSGLVSLTQTMDDGGAAEVGIFGRDAFIGASVFLGDDLSDYDASVQLPGNALRIEKSAFLRAVAEAPSFARVLGRFSNSHVAVISQIAACNALHSAEERLARWLLSVHDRADSDSLALTHEFLSLMLGTRRATVTVTAGVLERAGLIELGRGSIRILDRKRLHDVACECYDRVYAFTERIFAA